MLWKDETVHTAHSPFYDVICLVFVLILNEHNKMYVAKFQLWGLIIPATRGALYITKYIM